MRKSVAKELEDEVAQDLLTSARQSLRAGARGSGTTLTQAECKVILAFLDDAALV
jgi:hypothetical protein